MFTQTCACKHVESTGTQGTPCIQLPAPFPSLLVSFPHGRGPFETRSARLDPRGLLPSCRPYPSAVIDHPPRCCRPSHLGGQRHVLLPLQPSVGHLDAMGPLDWAVRGRVRVKNWRRVVLATGLEEERMRQNAW